MTGTDTEEWHRHRHGHGHRTQAIKGQNRDTSTEDTMQTTQEDTCGDDGDDVVDGEG